MYSVIVLSFPVVVIWLAIGLTVETVVLAVLGCLLRSTIQRVSRLEQSKDLIRAKEKEADAVETGTPV